VIIKIFEEQVEKFADKEALITDTTRLKYREVNARANQVANAILTIEEKLEEEEKTRFVSLLFPHGAEMIIAVLGTLKAEKAYLPLDVTYPEARLAYMLENSESRLVLTDSQNLSLAKRITAENKNYPEIIDIEDLDNDLSKENLERDSNDEKTAYILYTSGSTGKPKGVVQNHRNVWYYVRNWIKAFSISSADRMTLFSSFSHDGAGQDMFGALLSGATLYPFNILNRPNISDLSNWLINEKISIWHSVHTLFRYFVNTLSEKEVGKFERLRYILLGGEAIRDNDIRVFQQYFPHSTLVNVYGQTESSVSTTWHINPGDSVQHMLIGRPLDKTRILILDDNDQVVEDIGVGEIVVNCEHIALGYWKNQEATERVFSHDPDWGELYFTGDLGRLMVDGSIEFLGRKDAQVKIRGFRVETGEIETRLLNHPAIKEAIVLPFEDYQGLVRLCAYAVLESGGTDSGHALPFTVSSMRDYLSMELPEYMIPSFLIQMEKLPTTPSGKIDRKKLPEPEHYRPELGVNYLAPKTDLEVRISDIWKEVLGLDKVGVKDNFFDLGGNSFNILKIMRKIHEEFQKDVPVVSLFRYPTIHAFVEYFQRELDGKGESFHYNDLTPQEYIRRRKSGLNDARSSSGSIAVIGMAGRFPGADNVDEFWENLCNGVESISFFSLHELEQRGVEQEMLQEPGFVEAFGVLNDIEYFDAGFFNYSPNEALVMDPQLRLLHECSWEALENAGYNPDTYEGLIGIYTGNAPNQYWMALTHFHRKNTLDTVFLNSNYSTKVSYKLNLTGPSVIVQTACSTSLVAVHFAGRGLMNNECDIALAGGVSITLPDKEGYLYQEGMILSPDGHCRAFDARAGGTVFGNGVGMVVLRRLEEAVTAGDTIYAVIKGTAINNDGNRKVGLTAPSVEGQAMVIAAAHEEGGIDPRSIGYLETHGTGTILGDPVEIEALKLAFGTGETGYCALGSVKTNVGHLNSAAGIAGFIKSALAIKNRTLPPTLLFEAPNPKIDFNNSPFYVNSKLVEWERKEKPLRAGISSFGIGGTNAHVVLEEGPEIEPIGNLNAECTPPVENIGTGFIKETSRNRLLLISAKTQSALERKSLNLAEYFKKNPGISLADVAYTLHVGRKEFRYRQILVCNELEEAIGSLTTRQVHTSVADENEPAVVFMFPGQGSQYVEMGLGLYRTEPVFREEMDRCLMILKPLMGSDIEEVLYPEKISNLGEKHPNSTQPQAQEEMLNQTLYSQPLLFAVEYALAKLLIYWDIKPNAMIGHSIGEYVAACLSGVLSLEDALQLVVLRGRLMQKMPEGMMLSVSMAEEELKPLLKDGISLAAVNSSSQCVVSGTNELIGAFQTELETRGCETRTLYTSHAFHSAMMDPILDEFQRGVETVRLKRPQLPYVSNVTGEWITAEDTGEPQYWARHLRTTVRFSQGLDRLLDEERTVFLEVGPGRSLTTFIRQHKNKKEGQRFIDLLRHPKDQTEDTRFLLNKIGYLWLYGKAVNEKKFWSSEKRRRIPLPTYPFEKQHFWLDKIPFTFEGEQASLAPQISPDAKGKRANISEWFYAPSWQPSPLEEKEKIDTRKESSSVWLVLTSKEGMKTKLFHALKQVHPEEKMIPVMPGLEFKPLDDGSFAINPARDEDYHNLFEELLTLGKFPGKIIHLWNFSREKKDRGQGINAGMRMFADPEPVLDLGYYSLLYLAKAFDEVSINKESAGEKIEIIVFTDRLHAVDVEEVPDVPWSTLSGAIQVIPREYPQMKCRNIDVDDFEPPEELDVFSRTLQQEIRLAGHDIYVAYRKMQRWVRQYPHIPLEMHDLKIPLLRENGVYLITGGRGGIGLTIAKYLAKTVNARLILTGRSFFPPSEEWEDWLLSHESTDPVSINIREIRQLEELGAEVLSHSADAADLDEMREVVSQAEEKFGKINGIIHAAGLADGGLIRLRTREQSEQVFNPKIKGTLVLNEIFYEKGLDFFVLCSSISSILAPVGQVAYCSANAFLDAYSHYGNKISGGKTSIISINWDSWQEVGMAAKAVSATAPLPEQTKELSHPLFDTREVYSSDKERLISYLQVGKHWVLKEHRIMGRAVLPGTAYLEMASCALQSVPFEAKVLLEEVYFLEPLIVDDGEIKEVHTLLQEEKGTYRFSVISRLKSGEDLWIEHVRASISTPNEIKPKKYRIEDIEACCQNRETFYPHEDFVAKRGNMHFGPRWNGIRWVKIGDNQGLALLELPEEFIDDIRNYRMHPALMDVATTFLHGTQKDEGAYLPFYYKKIRLHGPLPATAYCYARSSGSSDTGNDEQNRQTQKDILRFDITIMDEQGVVIVEIEEFTLKKVGFKTGKVEQLPNLTLDVDNNDNKNNRNFSLKITSPGEFDSFVMKPTPRREPGPGEIEIKTIAVGMNFKEVLRAMGVLGDLDPEFSFGLECAGKIAACGEGVQGFALGDDVIAFGSSCFSPYVITSA